MRNQTGWLWRCARSLGDALAWARGRRDAPPGTVPFAYGRSATTFLWVITAMTAVETAIVEVAVPWAWLRIALAVVCAGGLPFMAGMVATYRVHPHLVGERAVVLRYGTAWEVAVPMSVIAAVGRTLGTAPPRPGVSGQVLDLSVGTADVVLTLAVPQDIPVGGDDVTAITSIRLSADDPAGFVRAVERARHALSVGR